MFTDEINNDENYCIEHNYRIGSCSGSQQTEVFTCKVLDIQGYESITKMTIFSEGKSNIRDGTMFLLLMSH